MRMQRLCHDQGTRWALLLHGVSWNAVCLETVQNSTICLSTNAKLIAYLAIIRIHRNGRLGKHFPNCDQIARREKKHSRYVPIPPGKDCVHVLLQMRILRIETEAYMLVHLDKVEMHRRVERELVTQSKISLQVNECTEISQSRRNEQLSQRTQLPLVCT